ncbi:MAG: tRNA epoxyqueuosine(34) reductase QueG [Magnetococcales bacterium]|nr:tRNA epoxyqueuosine(34) reductase QueG [Magnetococcales bacterium]
MWHELKERLRTEAHHLGLDVLRVAPAVEPPNADKLRPWIEEGCQASMAWLGRDPETRQNPAALLDGARSVVVVGCFYRPAEESLAHLADPGRMGIAAFAWGRDYHEVILEKLERLREWLHGHLGQEIPTRLLVDSGRAMEKPLAHATGIGWPGKNSLLVSRRFGCWLLLGEMVLPLPLPPDPVERDHCGSCRRCMDACPTGALDKPYRLDARRCLSYLTIEEKEAIPTDLRRAMGNRLFGCDDCLVACPWNRFAPKNPPAEFPSTPASGASRLLDGLEWDKSAFHLRFRSTPIGRLGRTRFLRNLAVALGNWGSVEAVQALTGLLREPEPLVRQHAAWGLGHALESGPRENNGHIIACLNAHRALETDPATLEELNSALRQAGRGGDSSLT